METVEWSWWYLLDPDVIVAVLKALWNPELLMRLGQSLLMIIGGLAQMMVPIVFIGGILFMIFRGIRQNRRIANQLTNDFPEIRCPSNYMEAVIRGGQRSMRN